MQRRVFIDCTHTVTGGYRTGVQRVVRAICRESVAGDCGGFDTCVPVILNGSTFVPANMDSGEPCVPITTSAAPHSRPVASTTIAAGIPRWRENSRSTNRSFGWLFDGIRRMACQRRPALDPSQPIDSLESNILQFRSGDILLLPDAYWAMDSIWHVAEQTRRQGATVAVVMYDIIPYLHPEIYGHQGAAGFCTYVRHVCDHAQIILAISASVADQLRAHLPKIQPSWNRQTPIRHFPLGAEFQSGNGPVRDEIQALFSKSRSSTPYLMVGTIEQRKNHHFALDAFERLWSAGIPLELCIVGQVGWQGQSFVERARSHSEFRRRLHLLHDVTDSELYVCYENSRGVLFTSIAEGFGLPIVEAQWHGRKTFVSDIPVHREVAGPETLFCDLTNPQSLADALAGWESLVRTGRAPAVTRRECPPWSKAVNSLFEEMQVGLDMLKSQSNRPLVTRMQRAA